MINPHICAKCDSMKRSCCTLRAENNEGLPAPISKPEIKRILNIFKDKKIEVLLEKKVNSSQFTHQMELLFPNMEDSIRRVFPIGQTHFELRTKDDRCTFKSSDGCILPNNARPLFCRIYPFWVFNDEPHIFQDDNCLAIEKKQVVPELFLSLGTNPEHVKQIHNAMCHDWGLHRSTPQVQKRIIKYN